MTMTQNTNCVVKADEVQIVKQTLQTYKSWWCILCEKTKLHQSFVVVKKSKMLNKL